MFECKLDPHIFKVLVTKLVNERARLVTKVNSDFAFYYPPLIGGPSRVSGQVQLSIRIIYRWEHQGDRVHGLLASTSSYKHKLHGSIYTACTLIYGLMYQR